MLLIHTCEVCGEEKIMTSEQAYKEGWDYPPGIGVFGVISPRTCGSCPIDRTLWWRLAVDKVDPSYLSAADRALFEKIIDEPASITPGDTDEP